MHKYINILIYMQKNPTQPTTISFKSVLASFKYRFSLNEANMFAFIVASGTIINTLGCFWFGGGRVAKLGQMSLEE